MSSHKTLDLIGYASGIAGATPGSTDGPILLKQSMQTLGGVNLAWRAMILAEQKQQSILHAVAEQCVKLADQVAQMVQDQQFFTVLGGDHTCAIGTWSGVRKHIDNLGLIWIDAHMDSHTPSTTLTGNLHGMPLACLLGYGDPVLTKIMIDAPKLKPLHVCLIGVRNYDLAEAELLNRLK